MSPAPTPLTHLEYHGLRITIATFGCKPFITVHSIPRVCSVASGLSFPLFPPLPPIKDGIKCEEDSEAKTPKQDGTQHDLEN